MKILEVCLSPGVGGLELYAANISKQLADADAQQVLAVARPGSLFDERVRQAGIATLPLVPLFRHLPLLAASKLARIIDTNKIDVIHMHWGKDLLLVTLAKRMSHRKPRLVYTRQMEITRDKHDWYHSWVFSQVDAYVAITEKLQQAAQKWLPMAEDNVKLLYYGVPEPAKISEEYRKHFLAENSLREDAFRVGLIGRIEHIKGQHVLLEAVKELVDEGHDVQAMVIGPSMDDDYLEELMRKASEYGLEERFQRRGFVDNPQAVMQCFDVITLCTEAETFGLVLVEAMRAGVSVIGTNAGGVPEIIRDGETGMLFAPENSAELAARLAVLIKDRSLLARLAEKGRADANNRFSPQMHIDGLRTILSAG